MKELFFEDNLMRYIDPEDVLQESVKNHMKGLEKLLDKYLDKSNNRKSDFHVSISWIKELKIKIQHKKANNISNFKSVIKRLNVEELHERINRSGDSGIADWEAELIMECVSKASFAGTDIYLRWIELECFQKEELERLAAEGLYSLAEEELERLLKRVGKLVTEVAIAEKVRKEGEFITVVRAGYEE